MNHIQRAWLKVLAPLITLVNERLAKRTGMLGKLGRFFAFGPRQFGYHPTNKYLIFINAFLMQNLAGLSHRYPLIKNWNEGFNLGVRHFGLASPLKYLFVFMILTKLMPKEFLQQAGTTLETFRDARLPAPYGALNDRVSAHYTEINSLYQWEMIKKLDQREKQITRERAGQRDYIKKTKFARPGYQYIEAHSHVN